MRVFESGWKTRELNSVVLDGTGRLLAAGSDDCRPAVVWDVATGAECARFARGWYNYAFPIQFLPTGNRLLFAAHDGWLAGETATGAVRIVLEAGWRGLLATVPESDWAVCWSCPSLGEATRLCGFERFDTAAQTVTWSVLPGDPDAPIGEVRYLACLYGGERFLSAEYEYAGGTRRLAVRSRANGGVLQVADLPDDYVHRVLASPASRAIAVQSGIWLRVYTAGDLHEAPRVLKNDNRKHFTGGAFHPSGQYLATTSNDATVKLYDTSSWEVAKTFTWDIGKMRSIAFSRDGALAAAGSDKGKVVVWDVDL